MFLMDGHCGMRGMKKMRNGDARKKSGSVKRKDGKWKRRNDASLSVKLSAGEKRRHEPGVWKP